ncbi:MAG: hypothetical protein GY857_06185 [Desulfobacula sp.]|nr:hypothetical protein [Desulfobacula sp.]
MKPVKINLVVKKNIWGKISLGLAALFVFTTCGFTIVNIYDYYANTNIIKTYETRLKTINKRAEQKRVNDQKRVSMTKEDKHDREDLNFLKAAIEKNMFPLTEMLSQIEKIKPEKLDINELSIIDNFNTIVIKGASNQETQISNFLMEMDRSKYFVIELSKEEINEENRIFFELTAKWVSMN